MHQLRWRARLPPRSVSPLLLLLLQGRWRLLVAEAWPLLWLGLDGWRLLRRQRLLLLLLLGWWWLLIARGWLLLLLLDSCPSRLLQLLGRWLARLPLLLLLLGQCIAKLLLWLELGW